MSYTIQERNKIRENYKYWYEWCDKMIWFYGWLEFVDFKPTVIEANFWEDIKSLWILMHPEYPVWKYFIDFADPINMIWVELDWVRWHKDKEKDRIREKYLIEKWWGKMKKVCKEVQKKYMSFILATIKEEI